MPFRDQEWEELQRDCDIFPAYSDFIFGPDERLVVTQEPGLHPMIYPMHLSAPIRYTNSMPSRSWSYKTTEGLEKSKNAAAQMLPTGQKELRNSEMSATNSGSSTPGLDVRSQIGSPLDPLLPPQGVRTVSEKEMTQRKALNTSQHRPLSESIVPFSPPQQQQPVRLTRQRTQIRNTQVAHRSDVHPQQPSLLRSSSTTDVDENLAQRASRHGPGMLSPSASRTTMLPSLVNPPQQQPQHGTGLSNNLSPNPALNASPRLTQQNPLLQPDNLLHNPRYGYLSYAKRIEIEKYLVDRWAAMRNSSDNALRAKALSDIQKVTEVVNKALLGMQKQRTQMLQAQQAFEAQTRPTQQMQQYQQSHQFSHAVAQPQLQPGLSPSQPVQPLPTQPLQQSPPQGPYYSISQASPQMQVPQQSLPQYHQAHHQPQQQTQKQYESVPNRNSKPSPTQPQGSAELRANIDRHIPQVWQAMMIVRNTSQPLQTRENTHRWVEQFRNSLPAEGRAYLMQILGKAMTEQKEGRDALAFLTSRFS